MRDFFYRKNDIIIVLIILIAAGFLIYNRIGVIMDYPAKLAEQQAKTQAEQQIEESEATESTEAADDSGSDD
ncbi:MAG: hypothetical protein E7221_07105 [Clostridiales bacterium]|nr:hypothetical protein [Clostridiales bacterium]MBQ3323133.1 hypothetical protein [Bacillota bacterium]